MKQQSAINVTIARKKYRMFLHIEASVVSQWLKQIGFVQTGTIAGNLGHN